MGHFPLIYRNRDNRHFLSRGNKPENPLVHKKSKSETKNSSIIHNQKQTEHEENMQKNEIVRLKKNQETL